MGGRIHGRVSQLVEFSQRGRAGRCRIFGASPYGIRARTRLSTQLQSSELRYPQMRELRTQSGGRPLRTLYAFSPLRTAILLIGGDKTGDDRWYETLVPIADRLFNDHLNELKKEGKI